jgi:hypothetical protein
MQKSRTAGAPGVSNHQSPAGAETSPVWAIACTLIVLAAMLATQPHAEMGISDDWSYIYSAKILAQTGNIVYTGWVAATVGWQLYVAALFIKLFGFSFTTVRASVMLITAGTVFLLQRTFVRAGLNPWNASLATLAILLSPLCLPLEVTYMTDIPGLFAVVFCLYACLRAIHARTLRAAIAWIALAALSNVVLGTSRQIAWLGALVMVPSALWILRRRRGILLPGTALWILSAASIFAIDHWFNQQPYIQTEHLIPGPVTLHVLNHASSQMLRTGLETVFLLIPILLMFLPALRRTKFPWPVYLLSGLVLLDALRLWRIHSLSAWFAPFLNGVAPFQDTPRIGALLTIATFLSLLAVLTAVLTRKQHPELDPASESSVSGRTLTILVLPFLIAYLGLLLPRAGFANVWDRYVAPLLFLALLFLLRFYQRHVRTHLPVAALLLIACFAAYGIAWTHDEFALHRAIKTATDEVLASGVPPTAVTGGWDYDAWTELQYINHVDAPGMRLPANAAPETSTHYGLANCDLWYCDVFPHVIPKYTTSLKPDTRDSTRFRPVPYSAWLSPSGEVYILRFH